MGDIMPLLSSYYDVPPYEQHSENTIFTGFEETDSELYSLSKKNVDQTSHGRTVFIMTNWYPELYLVA